MVLKWFKRSFDDPQHSLVLEWQCSQHRWIQYCRPAQSQGKLGPERHGSLKFFCTDFRFCLKQWLWCVYVESWTKIIRGNWKELLWPTKSCFNKIFSTTRHPNKWSGQSAQQRATSKPGNDACKKFLQIAKIHQSLSHLIICQIRAIYYWYHPSNRDGPLSLQMLQCLCMQIYTTLWLERLAMITMD